MWILVDMQIHNLSISICEWIYVGNNENMRLMQKHVLETQRSSLRYEVNNLSLKNVTKLFSQS